MGKCCRRRQCVRSKLPWCVICWLKLGEGKCRRDAGAGVASRRGGSSEAYEPGLYSQADLNQALPHSEPRVLFTPSNAGAAVDISILCLFLSWAPLQVLPWTSLLLGGPRDIVLGVLTPPALFSDPYSQLCKLERGHLGSRLHLCPVFSSSSSFSSFFFINPGCIFIFLRRSLSPASTYAHHQRKSLEEAAGLAAARLEHLRAAAYICAQGAHCTAAGESHGRGCACRLQRAPGSPQHSVSLYCSPAWGFTLLLRQLSIPSIPLFPLQLHHLYIAMKTFLFAWARRGAGGGCL